MDLSTPTLSGHSRFWSGEQRRTSSVGIIATVCVTFTEDRWYRLRPTYRYLIKRVQRDLEDSRNESYVRGTLVFVVPETSRQGLRSDHGRAKPKEEEKEGPLPFLDPKVVQTLSGRQREIFSERRGLLFAERGGRTQGNTKKR